MKNTWKGIRSIISLQKTTNDSPKIISLEDHTVTDPRTSTNNFDSFFCLLVAEVQSEVSFSKRFFSIYHRLTKTRFSSDRFSSNFKPKKSVGQNSIPTKILRILTDNISKHLSIIFNVSFATGIFPEKLKVAKVIAMHKKNYKVECSNYRSLFQLISIKY